MYSVSAKKPARGRLEWGSVCVGAKKPARGRLEWGSVCYSESPISASASSTNSALVGL